MIEMTFVTGGELVAFKIDNKKVQMKAKGTNYYYIDWNPLGLKEEQKKKLKKHYGQKWYDEFVESEKKFREMDNDKDIAQDLKKDVQKQGWRLVKAEGI